MFSPTNADTSVAITDHVTSRQIVLTRDLTVLRLSSADDRCITIDYSDSTSDKGGQTLQFKTHAERQLFCHYLRLLSSKVKIDAESEWAVEGLATCIAHRAETVSSIGLRTELVVRLDYASRTVAVAGTGEQSSGGPIDEASLQLHTSSPTRLDLLYVEPGSRSDFLLGGGATGTSVLQKVGIAF